MTTQVKIQTNGSYVAELKNVNGSVLGKAGPGNNVESEWIHVPHGQTHTVTEREATAEEIEAAKAPA